MLTWSSSGGARSGSQQYGVSTRMTTSAFSQLWQVEPRRKLTSCGHLGV